MKSLTDCYRLSNGVEIPCIGFGTWQTPDGDVCVSSVKAAIEAGYRHIDTAEMYENEDSVGKAIKESGIDRKELFITSKLSNQAHGYEKTMEAFEGTMEKLGLDYLDMFLIHWPNPIAFRDHWQEANAGSWKAFEELYKAGRIRAIGISNFRQHHPDGNRHHPPNGEPDETLPRRNAGGGCGLLPLQGHVAGSLQPPWHRTDFPGARDAGASRQIRAFHRTDLHPLEPAKRVPAAS